MITITREQLYQLFIRKQEELAKQLQQDTEKIHSEVMRQNELGKSIITIAYNSNSNDGGYLDILIKRTREIFIDSKITLNHSNEITIDWTLPIT
jgi:hypothetical protein